LKATKLFIFLLTNVCSLTLNAQKTDSIAPPNAAQKPRPNAPQYSLPDSLRQKLATTDDTLGLKTGKKEQRYDSLNVVVYSKDSLDAPVDYGATDSIFFDNANNIIHLYGAAYVNYNNLKLTAAYIAINTKENIATAEPRTDTTGKMIGIPNFKDGTQDISMKKLGYNFKTRKGVAYDVKTTQNDIFIHGGKSKFVSSRDSTAKGKGDDIAYSSNAIFTTCSADHPHFGIVSSKQKVIPNKLIVIGPSKLVIGDIPTPLVLPFGFFPLKQGKRTGLIFPQDYEYSPQWGFGFRNIGWYFPLADNYDMTVSGDIYVRGTFGVRVSGRYQNTYKNSGNLELGFNRNITEDAQANISAVPSWSIRWSHSQDQRANPNFTFNGSVNMQGSKADDPLRANYQSVTRNDFRSATQSQLGSSISFTQTFPGRPFSLSGSVQHSQNVATRDFQLTAPSLNFTAQTIFPFKQTKRVGEEKWYEKVAFQYNSNLDYRIQTKDSLLFTPKMMENAQFGFKQVMSSNVNFNLFKYFNFSPSVNYTNTVYLQQTQLNFNPDKVLIRYDTSRNPLDTTRKVITPVVIQNGKLDTTLNKGLFGVHQFNVGASLTTRIFGTVQFRKGLIRGIRHQMQPSIGFNYSPDYRRYEDSVYLSGNDRFRTIYNRYRDAIYGAPSGGKSAAITYSLTNLFELKTFKRSDSTFKKIKLLENVNLNGSYNMIADSFKFSDIAISTGTNFFKGMTTLGLNALYSPYGRLANGLKSRELALVENGRLLNFLNANISLNTSISIGEIANLLRGDGLDGQKNNDSNSSSNSNSQTNNPNNRQKQGVQNGEKFIDWFTNFRLSHQFSVNFDNNFGQRDTVLYQNAIYTQGDIKITKKWNLRVGNIGYDFVQKRMTYPDFGFFRDLHCWEMGVNWQPQRGTYSFYLRVKPGTLDFIKVPYNQNVGDSQFRRF
jgi:LptD protein